MPFTLTTAVVIASRFEYHGARFKLLSSFSSSKGSAKSPVPSTVSFPFSSITHVMSFPSSLYSPCAISVSENASLFSASFTLTSSVAVSVSVSVSVSVMFSVTVSVSSVTLSISVSVSVSVVFSVTVSVFSTVSVSLSDTVSVSVIVSDVVVPVCSSVSFSAGRSSSDDDASVSAVCVSACPGSAVCVSACPGSAVCVSVFPTEVVSSTLPSTMVLSISALFPTLVSRCISSVCCSVSCISVMISVSSFSSAASAVDGISEHISPALSSRQSAVLMYCFLLRIQFSSFLSLWRLSNHQSSPFHNVGAVSP